MTHNGPGIAIEYWRPKSPDLQSDPSPSVRLSRSPTHGYVVAALQPPPQPMKNHALSSWSSTVQRVGSGIHALLPHVVPVLAPDVPASVGGPSIARTTAVSAAATTG